jgi:signal transduction histidine kinase
MKKKKLNRWILPLMILSQVLIIGFSGFWLVDQYNKEKNQLRDKLLTFYINSENQATDSLIFQKFVHPVLSDSSKITLDVQLKIDTVNYNSNKERVRVIKKEVPQKKGIYAFAFNEKLSDSILCDTTNLVSLSNADDILVKGVKMFVHQTKTALGSDDQFYVDIINEIDETLFIDIFNKQLQKEGYDIDISWIEQQPKEKKNIFVEHFDSKNKIPGAYVNQTFRYLIKYIAPQILFVLFLVSLSLAAIIITYRNLILQLNLNEHKDNFISNITHELKTPVSTVKITLEALKKYNFKDDPKQSEDYMNMASKELDRLDGLISKVLDHSVLEQQNDSINFEIINLKDLIENVVESMRLQIENTNTKITIPDQKEIYIKGNLLYLEGVILNLIDNSIKYANITPEINISLNEKGNQIQMLVSDNGSGIHEEYKTKIFNKFYRISDGNKHNTKGYGLGLSFVNMVMKIHKGNIEVENNKDNGCTFTLTFPKTEG